MYSTLALTLCDQLFPRLNKAIRDAVLVGLGALLVAALAQIRLPLPFTPVPVTGQTLGVLLVGGTLGSRRGTASLLLYLGAGIAGLPFFAGGERGLAYLTGPTGGYLLGFVLAAYVVGLLAEQGYERDPRTALLPFLVGEIAIYLLGISWLAILLNDLGDALRVGFLPFIAGDVLKMVIAAMLLPAGWKLIE